MTCTFPQLSAAYDHAVAYRRDLPQRNCRTGTGYHEMLETFAEPLPETGSEGAQVIADLAQRAAPGLTPMAHSRFFGWVLGGSDPTGVAADWLVSAWGQNSAFHTSSPATSAIEAVAADWLLDILDLPRTSAVGFVTGGTVGNFAGLAAARGAVLKHHGWDADHDGLFGAPPVNVYLGDDAHTSVFSALGYLGFGRSRVNRIAADDQGRMRAGALADALETAAGPAIVIAQAGQINTGAFDPFEQIADLAAQAGAWLHVDGAFGLWARANPDLRALTQGIERADSWSTDGHKWLQTPFDSGYVICRDASALETAMGIDASYLPDRAPGDRIPSFLVPELSRRARGVPTWAMLKSLGRDGVADLIGDHCALARHIARGLSDQRGIRLMNDVVLNQVVVSFGNPDGSRERRAEQTQAVIDHLRDSGVLFVGGARWHGEWVMRISVICGATGPDSGDHIADAILDAWAAISAR